MVDVWRGEVGSSKKIMEENQVKWYRSNQERWVTLHSYWRLPISFVQIQVCLEQPKRYADKHVELPLNISSVKSRGGTRAADAMLLPQGEAMWERLHIAVSRINGVRRTANEYF